MKHNPSKSLSSLLWFLSPCLKLPRRVTGIRIEKTDKNIGQSHQALFALPTGISSSVRSVALFAQAVKAILISFVLASTSAFAQQAAPEPTLKPGSVVGLEPLAAATWVQGKCPVAFEPGKVYMFECWGTLCGPCIKSIPHINELHKKYYDKGLRIFGMNVFEDGLDKVEKFVKAKGEGMSYPVAYTGKGSLFENQWLKPAGVNAIPHAFIVKNGKIVFTAHPAQLTDSVIEALFSEKGDMDKIVAGMEEAKAEQKKSTTLLMDIRKAIAAKDADTLAVKIAELEKSNPATSALPEMRIDLQLIKKDWPAAIKLIEEMPTGGPNVLLMMMLPGKVLRPDSACPVEVVKAISVKYATVLDNPKFASNPMIHISLGSMQWKSGEKAEALASAKKAEETARTAKSSRPIPVAPFERFTKSLEIDSLPSIEEFYGWLKEEMKKVPAPATDAPAPPTDAPAAPATLGN